MPWIPTSTSYHVPLQSQSRAFPHPLQAALLSKLGNGSDDVVLRAVNLCDRYLNSCNNSEAGLEVLKEEVKKILSGQDAKTKRASLKSAPAAVGSCSPSPSKPGSPPPLAAEVGCLPFILHQPCLSHDCRAPALRRWFSDLAAAFSTALCSTHAADSALDASGDPHAWPGAYLRDQPVWKDHKPPGSSRRCGR